MAENCVAVPFPAVRHITYWLDRPQPAPGWGRFFESWRSPGAASLHIRHPANEKLRDRGDKLRRGERLFQKHAVRAAQRGVDAGRRPP
jgi:hypothetical protein